MYKMMTVAFMALLAMGTAQATEHHSGHGGGAMGGGGGGGACMKPKLAKFFPENMATAAPESEISFVVININHPDQIEVTIKGIEVEAQAEFKDPFYLVKAKLPASLRNTVARINVKVNAKSPHCENTAGWLVKISE
ncbi:hypothetical protein [Methylovulum psychrotolerans]|jgi:hypothetical protein|uniref:Copper-binding protein n=1 Tax=Methylovulum psychrotolerans TaxID=1704499 RepID=A0A1Z4C0M4_9GAMM|nr:hypothetical protein [Methylovulum psychrotolerans]ASF47061.1 hypothetical protein CEK71_13810 [Methylovulum psychrotolerans]MBT9098622.1 hypothetical protein [Methylovulum psychrotolerans]POZ52779.1 hypothetical protein AADEFJLK_01386 [Methylovulum psychrotolerans]